MKENLNKALRALTSAQLLLRADQLEGAANRAYYAFFYAAQVVVGHVAGLDVTQVRTHNSLRRLFDLHIVKSGLIDQSVATYFASVESTRIVADYSADPLQRSEIEASIERARAFVDACAQLLERPQS